MLYFPEVNGQLIYPAGKDIFRIEIKISITWLKEIFGNDLSPMGKFGEKIHLGQPAIFGEKSFPITKPIRETLMAIYFCEYPPTLKSIFIKGKLLELISLRSEEHTSELQSIMRLSYAV